MVAMVHVVIVVEDHAEVLVAKRFHRQIKLLVLRLLQGDKMNALPEDGVEIESLAETVLAGLIYPSACRQDRRDWSEVRDRAREEFSNEPFQRCLRRCRAMEFVRDAGLAVMFRFEFLS